MSPTDDGPDPISIDDIRREGLIQPGGVEPAVHDGTGRVQLRYQTGGAEAQQRTVRVPPGVTVFDAASWNGIAIDSTCGGHGTCKKCRVQVRHGSVPISRLDVRSFTPDQLRDGWRLACLAQATGDLDVQIRKSVV